MKLNSKLLSAFRTKLVIYIASIAAVFTLVGIFTYHVTKAQVSVETEGEVITVRTHAKTVGDVLKDLNIKLGEHDKISHNPEESLTSGMKINYTKAIKVTVSTDGQNQTYYTTSETIEDLFKENDIRISEHDQVSHKESAALTDGLKVSIEKAYQVTINDAGEKEKFWTTGGTVEELLDRENIKLGKLDRLNVKKDEELSKDSTIEVTRVEKVTDIVEEKTDYSVVTKQDSSLEKGKEKVVAPGEEGVVAKHFEVTLENGKEVDRTLIKEEVAKKSEQRIVAVGTKVNQPSATTASAAKQTTVSRGSGEASAKSYYMHATAYSANCSGCSGVTATGIDLHANPNAKVIAVDPKVIPLGSKVWVEGYGTAIAGDTGGSIQGNRIDLHVSSPSEASRFGSKKVQVKVLD